MLPIRHSIARMNILKFIFCNDLNEKIRLGHAKPCFASVQSIGNQAIFSLNQRNRYKLGRSVNILHKGRRERRLMGKGRFLLVICPVSGSLNQPTEIIEAIQYLLLLFQFLGYLFLLCFFFCFYSLHQNALSVAMLFGLVTVDAKDFGDVVLVDFEGKDYPYLAERLEQDEQC